MSDSPTQTLNNALCEWSQVSVCVCECVRACVRVHNVARPRVQLAGPAATPRPAQEFDESAGNATSLLTRAVHRFQPKLLALWLEPLTASLVPD